MAALGLTLASCARAPRGQSEPSMMFEERLHRAELGDPVAQYQLGLAYNQGREIAPDLVEAVRWIRRAADQGHGEAQNDLGGMYADGSGVPRDDAEAIRWWRRAAAQGVAKPSETLASSTWTVGACRETTPRPSGGFFAPPREVIPSPNVTWGRRTGWAVASLAMTPRRPSGSDGLRTSRIRQRNTTSASPTTTASAFARTTREAARWWRRAADQNHPQAQSDLGYAYYSARGVPQDDGEATIWFNEAARQGLAIGQKNLAFAYESGRGVPRDIEEAARWYRKAADQGLAEAQNALGWLHEHGRGVPADPVRAYLWYQLASAQGDTGASERQDALARHMTPAHLDEARRLAAHVTPGHEALAVRPATTSAPHVPAPTGQAAPRPPHTLIPREALFGAGRAGHPRLSPDGRRLAYLAPWNGVGNVWLRTVGQHDDRQLTEETERDIRYIRWRCDGEHLLFLHDPNGDEALRLYQIALDTGVMRDLTPPGATRVEPVGFEHLCNDPDASLFAVFTGTATPSVYRADLSAGRSPSTRRTPAMSSNGWPTGSGESGRHRSDPRRDEHRPGPGPPRRRPARPPAVGPWGDRRSRRFHSRRPEPDSKLERRGAHHPALALGSRQRPEHVVAEDPAFDVETTLTHPGTLEPRAVKVVRAQLSGHRSIRASRTPSTHYAS